MEHDVHATQTPWQRMIAYDRARLFGAETPVWFDWIAALVLVIAVDNISGLPFWAEWIIVLVIWACCVVPTSYYRAKAELAAEANQRWADTMQ